LDIVFQGVLSPLTPGVEWLGCEADHSPTSNAEVKNAWSYTSAPQYVFTAWCYIKQEICLYSVILG